MSKNSQNSQNVETADVLNAVNNSIVPEPIVPEIPVLSEEQKTAIRNAKLAKLSETGKKLFLIRESEQELKLKNKAEKETLLKTLKEEKEAKKGNNNSAGSEFSRTNIIGKLFRENPGQTKSFYLLESDRIFTEIHNVPLNPKSALTYFSLAYPIILAYDPTFTLAPEVTK